MAQEMSPPKQPWEVFPIQMDFSANMSEGEAINASQSAVVVTDTFTRENVTADLLEGNLSVINSTRLLVHIKGGVHKKKYKISFRAWISETKRLEEDLIISIRD